MKWGMTCLLLFAAVDVLPAKSLSTAIGGGLHVGSMNWESVMTGDFASSTPHHNILGGQIEVGLSSTKWLAYLGARLSRAAYSDFLYDDVWTTRRLLLGIRVHPELKGDFPLLPMAGAALTFGWESQRETYPVGSVAHGIVIQQDSRDYRGGFGLQMELGTIFNSQSNLMPFLLGQLHIISPDFPPKNDDMISTIYELRLHVGVLLNLRKPGTVSSEYH